MTNSHLKHVPIDVWVVTSNGQEWHHDNERDAIEQYVWFKDMIHPATVTKVTKTMLKFE